MDNDKRESVSHDSTEFSEIIAELYKAFKFVVSTWDNEHSKISSSKAYKILQQLHDIGLSQDEVFNHLHTYALQFRDCDEPRWDFICDLLDCVGGWCSPDAYIWHT